jgi:hypothetical protein
MYGWDGPYNEILLMSGAKYPPQVPLIDSHGRWTVKSVLGSFQDIRIEGASMTGRVFFSRTADGDDAFIKVKEGHLTDFSVGYSVLKFKDVEAGKECTHEGKTYKGPCRLTTAWELKELSICPIGADPKAKARGNNEGETMNIEDLAKRLAELEALAVRVAEQETELEALRARLARAEAEEEEKKKSKKAAKASKAEDEDEDKDGGEEDEEKDDEEEDEAKDSKKALTPEAAVTRERNRVTLIDNLCRIYPEGAHLRQSLIESGASVSRARAAVLEAIRAAPSPNIDPASRSRVQVTRDGQETFRAQVLDSLQIRMGRNPDRPAPGCEEFVGLSLKELARECLRKQGLPTGGEPVQMVGRALSTSDLPILLEETSRRELIRGFDEAAETWPLWTGTGTTVDFKKNTIVDHGIDNELYEINQDEEYENTAMVEASEEYSIGTFGRMFHIGRRSIINDDLGALTSVPARMGAGVQRLIGDTVYGVFNNNDVMGDGKPLFSSDHKNISAFGPDGIPTVAKMGKAINTMRLQKDMVGNLLNIQPEVILMPIGLEVAAETFFRSEYIGTEALPNVRNLYAGYKTRIYEPRLDSQNPNTFYLVGPRDMAVRVFYLGGTRVPYMEAQNKFDTDGVKYKVRFDFGVKAISFRSMVKCTAA